MMSVDSSQVLSVKNAKQLWQSQIDEKKEGPGRPTNPQTAKVDKAATPIVGPSSPILKPRSATTPSKALPPRPARIVEVSKSDITPPAAHSPSQSPRNPEHTKTAIVSAATPATPTPPAPAESPKSKEKQPSAPSTNNSDLTQPAQNGSTEKSPPLSPEPIQEANKIEIQFTSETTRSPKKRANTLQRVAGMLSRTKSDAKSESQLDLSLSMPNTSASKNATHQISDKSAPIIQKVEKVKKECEDNLKVVQDLYAKVAAHANNDPNGNLLYLFFMEFSSKIKYLEKEAFEALRMALCKANPAYAEDCKQQNALIDELTKRILSFINAMASLNTALSEKETDVFETKTLTPEGKITEKSKNSGKQDLLAALEVFSVSSQKLEITLNNLKCNFYCDEKNMLFSFTSISKYFTYVRELIKAYARCYGYNAQTVLKKGEPCYFDKNDSSTNATNVLSTIPRETSQYKDLLENLKKVSKAIAQWKQERKLPFSIETKVTEELERISNELGCIQSEINRATILQPTIEVVKK